jgi:hypothetical protein
VPNSHGPIVGREYLFNYRPAPPDTVGEAATPITGFLDRATANEWIISRWPGDDQETRLLKKESYPTFRICGVCLIRLTPKDEFFADPHPRPKWASRKVPVYLHTMRSNDMAPRWEKGHRVPVKPEGPKALDDYVLLEMYSGATMVRLLDAMTAETLTVTQHHPAKTTTIKLSGVKTMHRVIGLEEALYSA